MKQWLKTHLKGVIGILGPETWELDKTACLKGYSLATLYVGDNPMKPLSSPGVGSGGGVRVDHHWTQQENVRSLHCSHLKITPSSGVLGLGPYYRIKKTHIVHSNQILP